MIRTVRGEDGARIFHAAVFLQVDVEELAVYRVGELLDSFFA